MDTLTHELSKYKHYPINQLDGRLNGLIWEYMCEHIHIKEHSEIDIELCWNDDVLIGYITNKQILIVIYGDYQICDEDVYIYKYEDKLSHNIPQLLRLCRYDIIKKFMRDSGFKRVTEHYTVGDLFPKSTKSARNL